MTLPQSNELVIETLTVSQDLTVLGTATIATLVFPTASVATLTVTDTLTVTNNIIVGNDITVTGTATFGTLVVTSMTINTLTVTGTATMGVVNTAAITPAGGTTVVNGILDVTGNIIAGADLTVTDVLDAETITPGGGTTTVNGALNVTGGLDVTGTATADVVAAGDLTATGTATINNLVVTTDITGDNLTLAGNLTVNGTTTTVNSTVITMLDPIIDVGEAGEFATETGLRLLDPAGDGSIPNQKIIYRTAATSFFAGSDGTELRLARFSADPADIHAVYYDATTALLTGQPSATTVWFVDPTRGDDTNDGRTEMSAKQTIGAATALAGAGEIIVVLGAAVTVTEDVILEPNTSLFGNCTLVGTLELDAGCFASLAAIAPPAAVATAVQMAAVGSARLVVGSVTADGGMSCLGCVAGGQLTVLASRLSAVTGDIISAITAGSISATVGEILVTGVGSVLIAGNGARVGITAATVDIGGAAGGYLFEAGAGATPDLSLTAGFVNFGAGPAALSNIDATAAARMSFATLLGVLTEVGLGRVDMISPGTIRSSTIDVLAPTAMNITSALTTITGDLTVTGTATANALVATTTATANEVVTPTISATGGTTTVSSILDVAAITPGGGLTTVNGDLTVTGTATANALVATTTATANALVATTTATANEVVTPTISAIGGTTTVSSILDVAAITPAGGATTVTGDLTVTGDIISASIAPTGGSTTITGDLTVTGDIDGDSIVPGTGTTTITGDLVVTGTATANALVATTTATANALVVATTATVGTNLTVTNHTGTDTLSASGVADLPTLTPTVGTTTHTGVFTQTGATNLTGKLITINNGTTAVSQNEIRTGNGSQGIWTRFMRADGAGERVAIGVASGVPTVTALNETDSGYTTLNLGFSGSEMVALNAYATTINLRGNVVVTSGHILDAPTITPAGGTTTVNGSLVVTGTVTANALVATATATVGTDLTVTGDIISDSIAPAGGSVTVSGDLVVTGDIDGDSIIPGTGTTTITGDLVVTGTATANALVSTTTATVGTNLTVTGIADAPTLTPTGAVQTINGQLICKNSTTTAAGHRFQTGDLTSGTWTLFGTQAGLSQWVGLGTQTGSIPTIAALNNTLTGYSTLNIGLAADEMVGCNVYAAAISLRGNTTITSPHFLDAPTITPTGGTTTVNGNLVVTGNIDAAAIVPAGGTTTITGDLTVTGHTGTATLSASGVADLPTLTPTGGATTHTGDLIIAATYELKTDTINEISPGVGVTIDGVLIMDGGVVLADAAVLEVDTIRSATDILGVTIDDSLDVTGDTTVVALVASGSVDAMGALGANSLVVTTTATVGTNLTVSGVTSAATLTPAGGTTTHTGRLLCINATSTTASHRFQTGNGASGVWTSFGAHAGTGNWLAAGVPSSGIPTLTALNNAQALATTLNIGHSTLEAPLVNVYGASISLKGDVEITGGHTLTVDTINEETDAAGVTIEGVLIEDTTIQADSISFDSGTNSLSVYSQTSVNAVFSGPWDTPQNPTRTLTFIRIGNAVICSSTSASGINTVDGAAAKITAPAGTVPAGYRPNIHVKIVIQGRNDTLAEYVTLFVDTGGGITISRIVAGVPDSNFDASNFAGWEGWFVSWVTA